MGPGPWRPAVRRASHPARARQGQGGAVATGKTNWPLGQHFLCPLPARFVALRNDTASSGPQNLEHKSSSKPSLTSHWVVSPYQLCIKILSSTHTHAHAHSHASRSVLKIHVLGLTQGLLHPNLLPGHAGPPASMSRFWSQLCVIWLCSLQ